MKTKLLVTLATLTLSTVSFAHKRTYVKKDNRVYRYNYYQHGKVQFNDECTTVAYDHIIGPKYFYNTSEKCLALNPDVEASQNRYTDMDGSLQQAARDKADAVLVFDRNHDLSEEEASATEADLLRYSERLYIGESYLLKLNEKHHILSKKIDRIKNKMKQRRYGHYFLYFKLGFYKRYLSYIEFQITALTAPTYTYRGQVREGYIPHVVAKIEALQTKLGKGVVVESPYFQYSEVSDALSQGMITQGAHDEIMNQEAQISAALAYIDDNALECDFDTIMVQAGSSDQTFASLDQAIQAANPGAFILVGNQVAYESVQVQGTSDLTIVSRCDAEIQQLEIITSSNIVVDGLTIHNDAASNQPTVAIGVLATSIQLVNNNVLQSNVDGDAIEVSSDESRIWILGNQVENHVGFGLSVEGSITDDELLLVGNTIANNTRAGVALKADRPMALYRNALLDNGSYGITRVGPGTPELVLLGENDILGNNGEVISGTSSADIGNHASLLDSDDFDNITSAGDEGPGVSQ